MPAADQQLLPLFQAGRHHEVVAQARNLDVEAQTQPLAANVLAASLFQLGEYAQAASLLEDLEASLGQDRDYLSLYGATCRRLGLLQRAEQLLARALKLDPTAASVRNNYANLLIDLGRDQEARSLLEQLLSEQPDYQDARANLNRLQFREQPAPASWTPADPLMLAFSEEEVNLAAGAGSSAGKVLASQLPDPEQRAMASEQMQLAENAVQEGNHTFALKLCSQAQVGVGANATLYRIAADAYIGLRRFQEAEICLLQAVSIGGAGINQLINLVSLSSLRGDLTLANHYLDQAAGLDPSHPNLPALRENLNKRRQTLEGRPYVFQPTWAEQP